MAGPGRPKTGGRAPGTPNKTTLDFREAVNRVLEHSAPRYVEWLDRVAQDDPGKALSLVNNLAEYVAPRISRVEHVGDGGGPVQQSIEVTFVNVQEPGSDIA